MRRIKRLFAGFLCILVLVSVSGVGSDTSIYAASSSDSSASADAGATEAVSSAADTAGSDSTGEVDTTDPDQTFLYVDQAVIHTPDTQKIVLSLDDGSRSITDAIFYYTEDGGATVKTVSSSASAGEAVLFELNYSVVEEDLSVTPVKCVYHYTTPAALLPLTSTVTFDQGDNMASFIVTSLAASDEKAVGTIELSAADETSTAMTAYTINDDGSFVKESSVADALAAAGAEDTASEASTSTQTEQSDTGEAGTMALMMSDDTAASEMTTQSDTLVVAIDPGHDSGGHAGAYGNGLKEEELNLKVALACRDELETYSGVKVVMTRSTSACPYPGTSSGDDLRKRVDNAVAAGADVYVSIHMNAFTNASAHGALVMVQNSSWRPAVAAEGSSLGRKILAQINALGITTNSGGVNGIVTNNASETTYEDGSIADAYIVPYTCKLYNIPGIIVEHAFITNESDAAFLSNDANLVKLGIADATGIAQQYGLTRGANVTVTNRNDFSGDFHLISSKMTAGKKVEAHIWTDNMDRQIATMTETSSGTYELDSSRANLNGYNGNYYVRIYYVNDDGTISDKYACETSFTMYDSSASLECAYSDNSNTITASVTVTNPSNDIAAVYFPIWSEAGGQDDIEWYAGTRSGNTWSTSTSLTDHKSYGIFHVHAYAQLTDGSLIIMGADTTEVAKPSASNVTVSELNNSTGTFDITISGVSSSTGISSVVVPVWSTSNQSNIYWYTASRQSDGTYVVHADLNNHDYQMGTYSIHVYLTDKLGIMSNIYMTKASISLKDCVISTQETGTAGQFKLTASGVIVPGGYDGIYFAVWSSDGGQNDLQWYSGVQSSSTVFSYTMNIKDHQSYGTYNAHVYAIKGTTYKLLGTKTFEVTRPAVSSVSVENENISTGTFDIVVSGVSSKYGVASVMVPVWSTSDQSNIFWYTAEKQGDGTYRAKADLKNHDYRVGEYNIHVYLTDELGIMSGVYMTSHTVSLPSCTVKVQAGTSAGKYNLSASGVVVPGGYSSAYFAVWSSDYGQDDIKWYSAAVNSDGSMSYTMSTADHQSYGTYNVHAYAVSGSTYKFLGSTTFTVVRPTVGSVTVKNANTSAGTFDVVVSGITSTYGISKVRVPVWSNSDMSNIHWYEAEAQSDGTYAAHVELKNHDYQVGTYNVHVYLLDKVGIQSNLYVTTTDVSLPDAAVSAQLADKTVGMYVLKASGVIVPGGFDKAFFAVWSSDGGQNDLKWYPAVINTDGTLSYTMSIADHQSYGTYNIHAYAVSGSTYKFLGSTTFEAIRPSVSGVTVENTDKAAGTFDIRISGVTSPNGISSVNVPVWSASDQSNIYWYTASRQSDGTYLVHADIKNHGYLPGTYNIHVYITDNAGIMSNVSVSTYDAALMDCTVKAQASASVTGDYYLTASAVTVPGGYDTAYFAVWSDDYGQDDLAWYTADKAADGTLSYTMNIGGHGSYGTYNVHAYVVSGSVFKRLGTASFGVAYPVLDSVSVGEVDANSGEFDVTISGIDSPTGIGTVRVPVWSKSDQSDIYWYTAVRQSDGTYTVHVDPAHHNYSTGTYFVHVYLWDSLGISTNLYQTSADVESTSYHTIMGVSSTDAAQLARFYNTYSGIDYPSAALSAGGASSLAAFCQLYCEEAAAEGVKAEVAFAQAMLETGFLTYKGDVSISQYNFAGLGATGNGAAGNSFPDVRTGIRAQIQHLKCYASTEALVNPCVDPRWTNSIRGKAIYVEYLSQATNPYGTGWATDPSYVTKILALMTKLFNS